MTILATATYAGAADLTLKRVMLSSGGVGYFEYEAPVEGDATLTLDVALDQVDDVLKSLMVYDDGGRAGAITLPGREPLTQSLADLPFDKEALGSATALLNALQGSDIRIGGDGKLTGRLVHAEDAVERKPDGSSETRTRISLLTDSGLRQVTVGDVDTIEFVDPQLQAKIKTALTRLAAYHAQGRRELTLATHGSGKRIVRVGYVVAMPLWKASYRLSLPGDANAGSARLQGWAVLENFSGQPWKDVELTLLSGSPVTFRQALYESYYVPRPSVPVEAGGRVLPPADTGGIAGFGALGRGAENTRRDEPKTLARGLASTVAPSAAPSPPPPAPGMAPAQIEQAETAENATQIAFTLPYKVSVASGQSLVVPLIDRELPTRRLDLFQPTTVKGHPLAAIELTNAAATGLPPGVLTLYQQADRGAEYLGDARLAAFPAGEKRLLSYAVDNRVTVDQSATIRQSIVKATIAEGVMHVTRLQRRTTTYKIGSATAPPRLLIEQPRLGGWDLVEPNTAERTAAAYRIPAALDGKGNGTVTVVEEEPLHESLRLVDLNDDQLGVYIAARELDPKLHQALADLAQRRQAVSRRQAELDRLNQERARLMEDETRLRDNYTALKDEPAMKKRTLDKLNEALTAIDANSGATAKATAAVAAAQSDLAGYVSGLKL
ncbi:MAG TPA: DUF4139 domain-containing protein [Stellaceae bacterium]|nr:DUF4139 domain-containing protein [Stellaceae bacterium]